VFIDKPTVPIQLETLLDVLFEMRQKSANSETIKSLLQPKGLPDVPTNRSQATNQLTGAKELELTKIEESGDIRLSYMVRDGRPTAKEAILLAFDRKVLGSSDLEPWFGRLYAYVTAREGAIPSDGVSRDILCTEFNNSLPIDIERGNQLNSTKLGHYLRWYSYVGLGWYDPSKRFILDPTERLRRSLPSIFDGASRLDAAVFMTSLARVCPELDGGSLFRDVTSSHYDSTDRVCTQALSMALLNLHDDGYVELNRSHDGDGWGLEKGGAVDNGLQSHRFNSVAIPSKPRRK